MGDHFYSTPQREKREREKWWNYMLIKHYLKHTDFKELSNLEAIKLNKPQTAIKYDMIRLISGIK